MGKDSLDSLGYDFSNALVDGVTARNWPIVPNFGWVGDFRDKSNACGISLSEKFT